MPWKPSRPQLRWIDTGVGGLERIPTENGDRDGGQTASRTTASTVGSDNYTGTLTMLYWDEPRPHPFSTSKSNTNNSSVRGAEVDIGIKETPAVLPPWIRTTSSFSSKTGSSMVGVQWPEGLVLEAVGVIQMPEKGVVREGTGRGRVVG
jgi:hypothetical protein